MSRSIVDKIEPTGFIKSYIEYANKIYAGGLEYKLAGALVALSVCCGSNVVYPFYGTQRQWPILYVLLLGPAGQGYKTTSIGVTESLIGEVDSDLLLPNITTLERYLSRAKRVPTSLWAIKEFSAVLENWNRDFAREFRSTITDLYDPHDVFRKEKIGKPGDDDNTVIINKPAMNIFAASTPDWLKTSMKNEDLRGGLMGRFLTFPMGEKTKDPGINTKSVPHEDLITHLKTLRSLVGSWVDIDEVNAQFHKWNLGIQKRIEKEITPESAGFWSRLPAHVMKLAVLFCISDHPEPQKKYILTNDNLYKAITLGKWLTIQACELASTEFVKSKTEDNIQRLLKIADREGGVLKSFVLQNLHITARELKALEQTAVERGQLRIQIPKGITKPPTYYVTVKKEEEVEEEDI